MSDTKNTGGPAYPVKLSVPNYSFMVEHPGMTLRDYFAAMAMQGIVANCRSIGGDDGTAEVSFRLADAMLKAREQ
jgi:hypothetical protein